MEKDKIVILVPCCLKFTETVENSVNIILPLLKVSDAEKTAFDLKVVLNEAFVNVVNYCSNELSTAVQIMFDVEPHRLGIRIRDRGKGLPIQEQYPPYPNKMVGTKQVLLKTMDGEVIAYVDNDHTITLTFQEHNLEDISSEVLFESAKEGGMGISLMTKLMDEVRFTYLESKYNYLELVKYF